MRKQFHKPVFMILVGAIALLCLAVPGWSADKFELKFACEYMDRHPTSINAFIPWTKQMAEQSQGRLQIQFYNPNSLCPNNQTFASVVAGAVDIGAVGTIYNVGKFNLAEIIELPFLFNGAESASLTMWELYNRFPE